MKPQSTLLGAQYELSYRALLNRVLRMGYEKIGRNGATKSLPLESLYVDCSSLPLITGRRMYHKNYIAELLWILKGKHDIDYLNKYDVHIWDQFADSYGEVAPSYGPQLRTFNRAWDQLKYIEKAFKDPEKLLDRRLLASMWNPCLNIFGTMPACHYAFQVVGYKIDNSYCFYLQVNMRSSDVFVGLPYDVALYGLLGKLLEYKYGVKFVGMNFSLADAHVYVDHASEIIRYLNTFDVPCVPELRVNKLPNEFNSIADLEFEDILVRGYEFDQVINVKAVK